MAFLSGVITPSSCSWIKVSRVSACRALVTALIIVATVSAQADDLGLFAGHTDIGGPKLAGTVADDAAKNTYVIGGGGANMWAKADSFHYVWKKIEGDVALAADIAFPQAGGNAHRKGVLMIRQTLDQDSAYADAAFHGDGLTSLQFRETAGEVTHEVQAVIKAPKRLRLEKVGDYVYLSLAGDDGALQPAGCSTRLPFTGPFYLGLGVCAHDENAFETAVFANVVLGPPSAAVAVVRSSLEYVKIPSGDRVCVYPSREMITATVWAAKDLLTFTQNSRAFRVSALGGTVAPAAPADIPSRPTGASPDGKWTAAFEHQGEEAVLTLRPTAGGDARVLMRLPDQGRAPVTISWSPDSTKIAYVRYQPAQAAK